MRSRVIRKRISMGQYLEWAGIEPTESGFISCPLHTDDTPSLKIYSGERGWFCFSCRTGGGPAELHKAIHGLSLAEAVEAVAAAFGIVETSAERVAAEYKAAREQQDVTQRVVDAWHRETCKTVLGFIGALPRHLARAAYDVWFTQGIERVRWVCTQALRHHQLDCLEAANAMILDLVVGAAVARAEQKGWRKRKRSSRNG